MLSALTPLGKVARQRRSWLTLAGLYTAGGLLASVAVGTLLATPAALSGLRLETPAVAAAVALVGVLAAAREAGVVRFGLVQARRATRDVWAKRLGPRRAALLWGLDIGAFFTTWLTFAGAWWLVAVAALSGDVAFAAALFAAYWGGRALTVWLGPALVPSATITPWLPTAWARLQRPFQLVHAATVLTGAAVLAALAVTG